GNARIDARALQFLGQSLQGTPDPTVLRSLLQTASREQRHYSNRQVRELAARAGNGTDQAARVLAEGLGAAHRKTRSAAAQMLAELGGGPALPALPALVQRLFEGEALVRDHVAPAVARLVPDLHPEMQEWMCRLANPLLSPLANLRAALDAAQLPDAVREG